MSAQILIVDDEQSVRSALRIVLESEEYSVLEAPQGGVAMEMLQEHRFDLAIVDLFMPVQDGLETILRMRRLAPQVKIIAISGGGQYGLTDMLQAAKVLGADRVLAKPFDRQTLLTAVRELLAGDVS